MTLYPINRRLSTFATLIFLMAAVPNIAPAQNASSKTQQGVAKEKSSAATEAEEARLKQFLDKDGGYKDSYGGYYNPKAATYTDEKGGILDNWSGYTYKDGSYKSKLGDYWDAPTKTFKLANGETLKSDETTSAEAIKVLRDSVEENGGYDKTFIQKAMMGQIEKDHPLTPPKTGKRP